MCVIVGLTTVDELDKVDKVFYIITCNKPLLILTLSGYIYI